MCGELTLVASITMAGSGRTAVLDTLIAHSCASTKRALNFAKVAGSVHGLLMQDISFGMQPFLKSFFQELLPRYRDCTVTASVVDAALAPLLGEFLV
jgi:hypothetical protein